MPVLSQPDVPILIETPSRPFFSMVRCHYISVECDEPRSGWQLTVGGSAMPFLMLNLVGVVYQPLGGTRFSDLNLIDKFFAGIEEQAFLSVNFEDLWLPSVLFKSEPNVGDVYRLGNNLFVLAHQFRDGRHTQDDFEAVCKELRREILFSADETQAFKDWTEEQIEEAQNGLPKNSELQLQKKSGGQQRPRSKR